MVFALQHYGSLEALECDYSLPMTFEQWSLLNASPDEQSLKRGNPKGGASLLQPTAYKQDIELSFLLEEGMVHPLSLPLKILIFLTKTHLVVHGI